MLVLVEGEMHGYAMMQAIKQRSQGVLSIGPATLYTTIKRLLERAWIEELELREDSAGERPRYYRLSDFGERVLRAEANRLAHLVNTARSVGLLSSHA